MAVGDAIARSHACGTKAAGDASRTVQHLLVGHPLTAEDDDALAIGVVIHRRSKHAQQRGRQRRVTPDMSNGIVRGVRPCFVIVPPSTFTVAVER